MLLHIMGERFPYAYITFRSGVAVLLGFLVCFLTGPAVIALLKRRHIGERTDKTDSQRLAELHAGKKDTPTMGGLFFVGAVVLACLLLTRLDNFSVWVCFFVLGTFWAVGFVDDYVKLTNPTRKGISVKCKLLCQAIIGLAVGLALWKYGSLRGGTALHVPILHATLELGWGYPVFVMLVIMASSNAVNLTDGLDGLATGCAVVGAVAYAVIAYVVGRPDYAAHLGVPHVAGAGELTVVMCALAGGGLGFLWYNCYPARVFMGNTGALPLGGLIGAVAVLVKQELALFVVGAIFVVETASVILQIISFRVWGRRIFRIAPLHHHFQFGGWSETQVTVRFWIVAVLLALISLAALKL